MSHTRTFVVAEGAATHGRSLVTAQALVSLAAGIGADALKLQWVSRAERLCERRRAPEYLAAYRLLEFPESWFADLASRCAGHGIEFLCTAYIPEDVAVVARYVSRFKVSSFEAEDAHFVALHGAWPEKQLIISAGMNADVRESLRRYAAVAGMPSGRSGERPGPVVLHCVSAYPCPDDQIGLDALRVYSGAWARGIERRGLSDHTKHPWTGGLAVAAGARVIEFHIRLADTDPANADFAVARDPKEALEYVRNIREAESMIGDGAALIQPAEEPMQRYKVRGP